MLTQDISEAKGSSFILKLRLHYSAFLDGTFLLSVFPRHVRIIYYIVLCFKLYVLSVCVLWSFHYFCNFGFFTITSPLFQSCLFASLALSGISISMPFLSLLDAQI